MDTKPLQSVLVKPAGPDCNLNCEYCFYLRKNAFFNEVKTHRMPLDTLEELVKQVMTQGQEHLSFGWQGGEPTLMGLSFYEKAVTFQQQYGMNQSVSNGLQTNGLLIDDNWAKFFNAYNFLIGLSLDGPAHIHDHYRKLASGKGSWQKVEDSAKLLLDKGIAVNSVTVVNKYSANYPEEIYSYLKSLGFSYMQFIPCIEPHPTNLGESAPFSLSPRQYGDFLCSLFDLWQEDYIGGMPSTSIRHFDSLLQSYLGMAPGECTLQATCGDYLVIEHNGEVFSCDFFVQPSHRLGNITQHQLIEMLNSSQQKEFGEQKQVLATECLSCSWLAQCHGGCLKDRLYNPGKPDLSAFCHSYKQFFEYADNRLRNIAAAIQAQDQSQQSNTPPAKMSTTRDVISRNQPCQCGSGLRYKKCCGKND